MAPVIVVILFYVLHQDFWFWRETRPLVFGVLPPGLAYHVVYTALIAVVVTWLVRTRWPAHLEDVPKSHK